jgi:predicted enzyme related to lactoylglutathione lyase
MKITEIAFTIYGVSNLAKGRDFYEKVLGLTPSNVWEDNGMGMIEYDIASGTLAIGCGVPEYQPGSQGGNVALEVEDFDQAVETLKKANCPFVLEPMETSVCFMATFKDPDGNQLMIHKRKSK